jgi:methionine-rich copper-binding protein CopC
LLCLSLGALLLVIVPPAPAAAAACDAPVVNEVACENTKTGNLASEWDISGSGSASIQGFATDISVNRGSAIGFKVDSGFSSFRMDIYRMGYYGGRGARKVATINVAGAIDQLPCKSDGTTGLVDCGNWTQTASWAVPADAVSGVYFAKLVAGTAASHITFIVRNDASHADLFFQTSDTTWQAYNSYGGNSLYVGSPAGRAYKVSYNRPFNTRDGDTEHDWVFNAEYPAIRFMEANGYDLSYTTGLDTDRSGSLIKNHKTFLSVGHDEYWSGNQRANVEAARDAGVNLAFFSGNEVFWKTRWENSLSTAGNTPYRTLVTYKETHANKRIDPLAPSVWTGTWRDPRFSPPADGGRPENALTGTIFSANCCTTDMTVDGVDGQMRFWRNTRVAGLPPSQKTTLGSGILGYEWDESPDNGSRPAGAISLSTTTENISSYLQDYGSNYAAGTATHHLTMYRAASGALVFGAGSIQWAWGLDDNHALTSGTKDAAVQQATVNLFADMGAQPATLQSGLTRAVASTDATAPTSTISAPAAGATIPVGQPFTISGTATDTGGKVGGVEVSTDNGSTWHPANGRGSWSYAFTPGSNGTMTIKTRATDDSLRTETPGAGRTVTVGSGGGGGGTCPCTLLAPTSAPAVSADPDTSANELGVKFSSSQAGFITGIRYYKDATNTGTHVGNLWSAAGTNLATATFLSESASGWQQVSFASPVAVSAGTTYVASYFAPNGHYAATDGYFSSALASPPLTAPAETSSAPNGVFKAGGTGFPNQGFAASNYWVDVVFAPSATDTTKPTVTARTPASGSTGVSVGTAVTATFSEALQPGTAAVSLSGPAGNVAGTLAYDATSRRATFTPGAALAPSTTYTVTASGAKDTAGNVMTTVTWTFTTAAGGGGSGCPCTIWPSTATPGTAADPDNVGIEVGVKFRASQSGKVTGIRFYKGATNTGTHTGSLWSRTGTRLGTVTFSGESASGWQQATFVTAIDVTAGTTYVASYFAPAGHYAVDESYFSAATTRGPLTALADGTDGTNGVYTYGSASAFPTSSYKSSNYWVDPVFTST